MKVLLAFCLCVGAVFASRDYERSCEGKADPGMCLAYMPMFYYDAETDTCKRFVYGGCQGNGNRYGTEEECLQNCKGYGQKAEEDVCSLPPEEGMCRGYFPSYYFDAETGTCKKMVYGGCGGNGNRFASKQECYKRCSLIFDAVRGEKSCEGKGETGLCDAYFPMFYYDAESGTCKRFVYGGCGGNNNRYATEKECLQHCQEQGSKLIDCKSEPETGLCRGSFPRYYYDELTGECKKFVYGGCGGNENNFLSKAACTYACGRD